MLRRLYIRNFALIDELETSFVGGLNVITGETGAGKSILIGALKLILGARSSSELVRTGETKAVVEALFEISDRPDIQMLLRETGLDAGPDLIVRREITKDHSRAFVNDSPVKLDALKRIAATLVDLHGQHDHQSILRNDTHLPLLDGFGIHVGALEAYRASFSKFRTLHTEKTELVAHLEELTRDRDLAEFQITEIDGVSPAPEEEVALNDELNILEHLEQLVDGTQSAFQGLYGGEESVYDRVSLIVRQLEVLQQYDNRITAFANDLRDSMSAVADIAAFMRDYAPSVEFDPERADEIRHRLGAFEMLKRKYGGSIDSVIQHRERIGVVYETAGSCEESIHRLNAEISKLQPELGRLAEALSSSRRKSASKLEKAVVEELASLSMNDARFVVSFSRQPDAEGWIVTQSGERVQAFEDGLDICEFYLSANRGEPPKPLAKVASGGEASRIMLALKTILARSDRVSTLVFDEIDVGISGAVAERVGKAMRTLSTGHQVVAITHLPQIAAAAEAHYVVRKEVAGGRTTTTIQRLDADNRAREIASLLSGAEISSAALESARQLIGH
ncbi:MAG: DNA repair protein RecN [Rhodothermia bacterium]